MRNLPLETVLNPEPFCFLPPTNNILDKELGKVWKFWGALNQGKY